MYAYICTRSLVFTHDVHRMWQLSITVTLYILPPSSNPTNHLKTSRHRSDRIFTIHTSSEEYQQTLNKMWPRYILISGCNRKLKFNVYKSNSSRTTQWTFTICTSLVKCNSNLTKNATPIDFDFRFKPADGVYEQNHNCWNTHWIVLSVT